MSQDHPPASPRQSRLPIVLTLFALVCTVLLLWGAVLFLGLVVLAGLLHYLLWGYVMDQRTEGEREEERLRQEAEADPW